MISYLKDNIQLYAILILWLFVGMFGGPVIYGLLPLTILLMIRKDMFEELVIGYLFILILSDNQATSLLDFSKNLKNIYISLLAFLFFIKYKHFYGSNFLFKIFIPFFAFSLLTMSMSINDSYFFVSIQKTISYALTILVLPHLIIYLYINNKDEFVKRFVYFVVLILIVGIALKYLAPDLALLNGTRFRGLFGGPNGLGIFCVLFFISFFILDNFSPKLFLKGDRIFILGIILLSLIWTGSRNALIAIFIFYFFYRFFSQNAWLSFFVFMLLLYISELLSSNATVIINTLGLGEYFRVQTLEEGSGRLIAWGFAWMKIQENFFIGKGFAYNEAYMRAHYGMLEKLGHQGGIHNSFLTFWFDQGLIGLLIYLRSYILLFIKAAKRTKFAFPTMFAISFTAFFESWLVGSLSAFAFMGIFIFTILTSDEIIPQEKEVLPEVNV